jgi:hypothetical protein
MTFHLGRSWSGWHASDSAVATQSRFATLASSRSDKNGRFEVLVLIQNRRVTRRPDGSVDEEPSILPIYHDGACGASLPSDAFLPLPDGSPDGLNLHFSQCFQPS